MSRINPLAVLVAALTAFLVAGMWYTALFGKLWVRLHGYSDDKVKQMKATLSPLRFFGGMLLSYLVLAAAVALLLTPLAEPSILSGAAAAFLNWTAAAAIAMTDLLASDKVIGIYFIDISCQLVYVLLIGVILGAWR